MARPLMTVPRRLTASPFTTRTLPSALRDRRMMTVRMLSGEPDRTVVETCTKKITDAISPIELKVEGAYDDPNGSHITIYCVSEKFEGMRSMKRQQLVFKAIWEEMQGAHPLLARTLHATLLPCKHLDHVN